GSAKAHPRAGLRSENAERVSPPHAGAIAEQRSGSATLEPPHMRAHTPGGFPRLFLLRKPGADGFDSVEDQAADLDARRPEAARGETLQRTDGTV
ncbi:MAG: hypothetical protein ACLP3R_10475, partial [Candidatus Korobacteraceae bacterium]